MCFNVIRLHYKVWDSFYYLGEVIAVVFFSFGISLNLCYKWVSNVWDYSENLLMSDDFKQTIPLSI